MRQKPLVIEKDGVRVAVAVQVSVNTKQAAGGCDHECRHELPVSDEDDAPGVLGYGVIALATGVRLAAAAVFFGTGRALLLALNILGLLGAKLARAYLLGWASVGGTHKQLSRRISPWLPETNMSAEYPALVCEAFERPKHIDGPPQYTPRISVDQALWLQRKQLGYQLYPGAKLPPELPAETNPKRKERS